MSSRPDQSTPVPGTDDAAGSGAEEPHVRQDDGAAGRVPAGSAEAPSRGGGVDAGGAGGPAAGRPAADGSRPGGPDEVGSGAGGSGAGDPGEGGAAAGAGTSPAAAGEQRPRAATRVGPRAMRKPERGETTIRDMLGALLILIPVGLLLFSVGSSCSFAPTGPVADPDSVPAVDAGSRLTEYAHGSTFPLRVPDVPFRANSTDRGPVEGGGTAVRIGYVTPDARYLSLVQTDAPSERILATESGAAARGEGPPLMRGTVQAGGLTWETYQRNGGEPFRVTTLPGRPEVRALITGSGSDEQFTTLATALSTARVLPPTGSR